MTPTNLHAESITVMREVAGQFERPVLLFSGGKDSVVLLHLARMAFAPAPMPFAVMHIDTGHNLPEVIAFRDRTVREFGLDLIVAGVQDDIDAGLAVEPTGPFASRNLLQTGTLLRAIQHHGFDAVLGGARRDEEPSRAKERVFSHRDASGQWNPKQQRPELWGLYNGKHHTGEHMRVFPLSNWTELDIWRFIEARNIPLPSLYFAHRRLVFLRDGLLMPLSEFSQPATPDEVFEATVRFRTVGDATCTAAIESTAATAADVVAETSTARVTERGSTRVDDRISAYGMEDRKRQGYF